MRVRRTADAHSVLAAQGTRGKCACVRRQPNLSSWRARGRLRGCTSQRGSVLPTSLPVALAQMHPYRASENRLRRVEILCGNRCHLPERGVSSTVRHTGVSCATSCARIATSRCGSLAETTTSESLMLGGCVPARSTSGRCRKGLAKKGTKPVMRGIQKRAVSCTRRVRASHILLTRLVRLDH